MEPHQKSSSDAHLSEDALLGHFEPILRQHAGLLDSRWWRWPQLGPSYHVLAGALYWADEYPGWWKRRGDLEDALRALWHYRTGLILGEPRRCASIWDLGKRLFP